MAKKWSDMNEEERKAAREAEMLRRRRNGQAMNARRRASFLESHPELAGLPDASIDALIGLGERPRVSRPGGIPGSPAADTPQTLAQADQQRAWDEEWNRIVSEGTRSVRGAAATAYKPNDAAPAAAPAAPTSTASTTATVSPAGTSTAADAPASARPADPSTPAPNPASGAKRVAAPSRTPLVAVNRNDRTGTTVTLNGQGMRPTTENMNLVSGIQRNQLLDAPTGVDVTSPLYTNADVRLMRRRAAETQRYKDIREETIAARKRADETARSRGALRNADDWKYYGTVANTGGDGWKKGGSDYNGAMEMLRGKVKSLQELGAAGYAPSSQKALANLVTMVEDSDKLGGLSQRQIEVANGLLNGWTSDANSRKEKHVAAEKDRINTMRQMYGIAEGTSDEGVLTAVKAIKGKAVSAALDALRNPDTWNSPDYYTHLETIRKNSPRGEGLASSFKAAMRDPATRQRYNDAVTNLTGGGVLPDDEGIANLQNKFAIEHMQAQRSAAPTTAASPAALTDEEKRRLGIQAAQVAGDALRPRRKGVI